MVVLAYYISLEFINTFIMLITINCTNYINYVSTSKEVITMWWSLQMQYKKDEGHARSYYRVVPWKNI